MESISLKDVLIIGFAQMLALMPGVSRSGITMTAGLFVGMKRETAARFSFLLAMPITFGAALMKLKGILVHGIPDNEVASFVLGVVFATLAGFFVIKYLLKFLQSHSFAVFVWYRLGFGAAVIAVYFLR
jgi:undecaprenyl-diphosphatase